MASINQITASAIGAFLATTCAAFAETDRVHGSQIEFVPLVQPCIDMPGAETCAEVRAVISECAEDLEFASCDVLFQEADEVFDKPDLKSLAEVILQDTRDAMPEFPVEDDGDLSPEALEAARATAERTYLRGDANQMTHSQPELLEGELDEEARDVVEDNGTPVDAD